MSRAPLPDRVSRADALAAGRELIGVPYTRLTADLDTERRVWVVSAYAGTTLVDRLTVALYRTDR